MAVLVSIFQVTHRGQQCYGMRFPKNQALIAWFKKHQHIHYSKTYAYYYAFTTSMSLLDLETYITTLPKVSVTRDYTLEHLSKIKKIDKSEMDLITTNNFHKLFFENVS